MACDVSIESGKNEKKGNNVQMYCQQLIYNKKLATWATVVMGGIFSYYRVDSIIKNVLTMHFKHTSRFSGM